MGRILALDPGTKRVGVAVSDPLHLTAQPHGALDATAEDLDVGLKEMVEELDVERIVVGLPVGLSGEEGAAARAARAFAARVAAATGLPVELHDERFSTTTAERALLEAGMRRRRRRETRDRVAAAVFLQAYLDAGKRPS
jgi:putative Holliday junction resolvase